MKEKKVPMRQCIGCRLSKPKRELIRVVRTPDDQVVLDDTGRQNGRGAYICPLVECFEKARKTKAVERAFGIKILDEVYDNIERQMLQLDEK